MVDGVPVNDDQTGHFHLDQAVPLDAIERIEVLRGPVSALYGSGHRWRGQHRHPPRRGAKSRRGRRSARFGAMAVGAERPGRDGSRPAFSADHDRSDGHRAGTDHASRRRGWPRHAPLPAAPRSRRRLRGAGPRRRRVLRAVRLVRGNADADGGAALAGAAGRSRSSLACSAAMTTTSCSADDPAFYRNVHREPAGPPANWSRRWLPAGTAAGRGRRGRPVHPCAAAPSATVTRPLRRLRGAGLRATVAGCWSPWACGWIGTATFGSLRLAVH
jgi:hypothetical protein